MSTFPRVGTYRREELASGDKTGLTGMPIYSSQEEKVMVRALNLKDIRQQT
jgi:hypothetical protein